MLDFKCYGEVVTECYYKAQDILLFSVLLSKHLKNTCEKGYFLVKLQGGSFFRHALVFLNLSVENSAKQFVENVSIFDGCF